jgi:hypothetical protein
VLPGYKNGRALVGEWEGLIFIVTQDDDGHTEVSLSARSAAHPASRRCRAFFRMWGVTPEFPGERRRTCIHWVVKRGTLQ